MYLIVGGGWLCYGFGQWRMMGEDLTSRLLMVSMGGGGLDYLPSQGLMTSLLQLQTLYITTHCSGFSRQVKMCFLLCLIQTKSIYSVTFHPCELASSRHDTAQSIELSSHVNDLFQALWAELHLEAPVNLVVLGNNKKGSTCEVNSYIEIWQY